MAVLNIKDQATYALARKLADRTGQSLTASVRRALEHELERVNTQTERALRLEALNRIVQEAAALPVLDSRTPDEIIGYDENGLPS
ncbi:MAG: type II toxin-antitoxin system VapB family antitoxin [Asticcacaulis sp.]